MKGKLLILYCALISFLTIGNFQAKASDHLDTPSVINDPAADIGDLYTWMSADGRRLNLVMTIVGKQFSDRLQYVFHVDSGKRFGKTSATTTIVCEFNANGLAECWTDNSDYAKGEANNPQGLESQNKTFRVFAGLRDDPFFNNVRGTRAALNAAAAALKNGTQQDLSGCPNFDGQVSADIFNKWQQTEGGAAKNLLAGWKTGALIVSIDIDAVAKKGKQLAVWAGVHKLSQAKMNEGKTRSLGEPVERMGRALTANMLIGPLDADEVSDARKEEYNRAAPKDWKQFAKDFERSLGLFDGYDRNCGNQWLSSKKANTQNRYQNLSKTLADDRLWVNANSRVCEHYLAVELANLNKQNLLQTDCGGRTPNYNADAVFRSLLVEGTADKIYDGLQRDDAVHSTSVFPFLAPPLSADGNSYSSNNVIINSGGAKQFTTNGLIAVNNLDHLINQVPDESAVIELLLTRSRFLGDYEALHRAVSMAEITTENKADFLLRAKSRAAIHRFRDALSDLKKAEDLGAGERELFTIRASILMATGHTDEVITKLKTDAGQKPSFASFSALANAYAAQGSFDKADNFYQKSLDELKTTSPFPYAWIYFARGLMWSEQANEKTLGEKFYKQAIEIFPEFALANIHLAEIEIARGEKQSGETRLRRVIELTDEPEAMEILGELLIRSGDLLSGNSLIARSRQRYENLLEKHPLAFADHAAEFYLRTGLNAERALNLAEINLENRETEKSYSLAIRAAKAADSEEKMLRLIAKAETKFGKKFNYQGEKKMEKSRIILLALILGLLIFTDVAVSQQKRAQPSAAEIEYIVEDLVNCYIDSLNETNDKKRMEIVEVVWHKDGIFAYPGTEVKGFSAINSDVFKVQKRYPKAIVKRVGDIDIIENKYIRFNWEFGVRGEEPLIKGFDFGHMVDGRLKLVVGYFDYISEKAK